MTTSRGEQRYDWSPEGESIVFVRGYSKEEQGIVIRDVQSGAEREILREKALIRDVCWSPTGHILFSSDRKGNMNVWVVPAEGGEPIQVTKGIGFESSIRSSGDGRRVLHLQEQIVGTIWSQLLERGSSRQQVTFEDTFLDNPAVSPDGKTLVFRKVVSMKEGAASLVVMERSSGSQRELASGAADEIRWSPDGRYLVYVLLGMHKDSSRMMIIDILNDLPARQLAYGDELWWASRTEVTYLRGMKTWIRNVEGGDERQVFKDSTLALYVLDKSFILFSDLRQSDGTWWIIKAEGGQAKNVEQPRRLITTASKITVAPKGDFIVCITPEGVLKIELPSGKRSRAEIYTNFVNGVGINPTNIRQDGKEIVSAEIELRGRLILLENVFTPSSARR